MPCGGFHVLRKSGHRNGFVLGQPSSGAEFDLGPGRPPVGRWVPSSHLLWWISARMAQGIKRYPQHDLFGSREDIRYFLAVHRRHYPGRILADSSRNSVLTRSRTGVFPALRRRIDVRSVINTWPQPLEEAGSRCSEGELDPGRMLSKQNSIRRSRKKWRPQNRIKTRSSTAAGNAAGGHRFESCRAHPANNSKSA